jgi:hypothetical protein
MDFLCLQAVRRPQQIVQVYVSRDMTQRDPREDGDRFPSLKVVFYIKTR